MPEDTYTLELPTLHAPPVKVFLPMGYEAHYPYPLVILLHGHGGCNEQVLKYAPLISRRNFIYLSLRAPKVAGVREDGLPGYSWGTDGEYQDYLTEYLLRAAEQVRRVFHIHSERIYLAGFWEGASVAYRLGLSMPEKLAGIIAMNGVMPRTEISEPLTRIPGIRRLKAMIGYGLENEVVPIAHARRDHRVLYSAGLDVSFEPYLTNHQLHPHMFRDINRWIVGHLETEETFDPAGIETTY